MHFAFIMQGIPVSKDPLAKNITHKVDFILRAIEKFAQEISLSLAYWFALECT